MRFPKIQNANWKRLLIDKLIANGNEVSLIFGESSFTSHLKFSIRNLGLDIFNKKRGIERHASPKLLNYFSNNLQIHKVNDLNSNISEKLVTQIRPDLLLLLGSGIIRKNILEIPHLGTIHCHQGHLPEMRGVNTIQWSILLDKDVYITVHFVEAGIDTGDILAKQKIAVSNSDTIDKMYKKCNKSSVELISQVVKQIKLGNLNPIRQGEGKQYFSMHPFFISLVENKLR